VQGGPGGQTRHSMQQAEVQLLQSLCCALLCSTAMHCTVMHCTVLDYTVTYDSVHLPVQYRTDTVQTRPITTWHITIVRTIVDTNTQGSHHQSYMMSNISAPQLTVFLPAHCTLCIVLVARRHAHTCADGSALAHTCNTNIAGTVEMMACVSVCRTLSESCLYTELQLCPLAHESWLPSLHSNHSKE
jgi:hypothetical protein